jgi:peptidoglycan/LPS O-acetylase OafA/YrhL
MNRRGEIASLTGLRGLAALLVVIGHFSVWTIVAPRAELPTWIAQWGGATPGIGMSIFFTLSGYVIALSYAHWNWRERPGFNLVRFFFYRFARLYPAFFVFAIVILVRSPSLRDLSNPEAQAYLAPHLLLWQSWLPVKYDGALVSDDLFHVSWSLSTECGLYLLFGLGAIIVAALAAMLASRDATEPVKALQQSADGASMPLAAPCRWHLSFVQLARDGTDGDEARFPKLSNCRS